MEKQLDHPRLLVEALNPTTLIFYSGREERPAATPQNQNYINTLFDKADDHTTNIVPHNNDIVLSLNNVPIILSAPVLNEADRLTKILKLTQMQLMLTIEQVPSIGA